LTVSRLIGKIGHPALPHRLTAGHVAERGASYVAYEDTQGEPLSARITREGPMHFKDARPILHGVLEGLAALHERGIAHGNLKLENIIVSRGARPTVIVVDGAGDRLRLHARVQNGHS